MQRSAIGFIITLALSILMDSLAATMQPCEKMPLVGVLRPGYPPNSPDNSSDSLNAFRQGLRDLGYSA